MSEQDVDDVAFLTGETHRSEEQAFDTILSGQGEGDSSRDTLSQLPR